SVGLLFWQNKYLVIKQIIIQRNNKQNNQDMDYLISEQEIYNLIKETMKEKFLFVFHRNTLLSLTKSKIKNKLLNDSRLKMIKLEKKWPAQLIVTFTENQPAAIISIRGDKDYYLSSTGQLIYPHSNILRHLDDPIIFDKTTLTWQNSLLAKTLKIALNLIQKEKPISDGIIFKTIEINTDQGIIGLKAISNEGWQAYFAPTEDINQQITNLEFILKNQLSDPEKRKDLEYIDLRFGNRVYYK
ncbi:MAG: cell division protein FtsQ/DivIB, partial [Patescibacteria group bacterium]